jgi:thiosulfate dehydrogenase [quinone] large subunit
MSSLSMTLLVILRIGIGWHCLYEGLAKLFDPRRSSANFLLGSSWIFSGFFSSLALDAGSMYF